MGRGYHATLVQCRQCRTRFRAYKDRKGQHGKLPKYCSRACYLADVRAEAESKRQLKAST